MPFPIWLPLPSVSLWALTVLVGYALLFVPEKWLRQRVKELPLPPRRLGWQLIRLATLLLWSGSFTLCDVTVQDERVRVQVQMY